VRGLLVIACAAALGVAAPAHTAEEKRQAPDVPVVCHDVALVGKLALLGQTLGLSVWDVSEPLRPHAGERLPLPATVLGVHAALPLVYLAAGTHGLYIARLQDAGPPEIVSRFDTPGEANQVVLHGSYALLADARYGLRVIDVSDPVRPLQKAQVATRDQALSLALSGDVLALAERRAGVRLFDVSRPEAPTELHVIRDMHEARDVVFAGKLLLVAAAEQGLWVYGFERGEVERGKAERVGKLEIERGALFVGASGDLALVSNGTPALTLVTLDEQGRPSAAEDKIRLHRSAPAHRIHLQGTLATVALDRAGLGLVDLENRAAPMVLLPREREFVIEWPQREPKP